MKILDVTITTDSRQEILNKIESAINSRKKFVIFTPNPEMITFASKQADFKRLLNNADVNLPDGVGLKIACNLKNGFTLSSLKAKKIFADLFSLITLKSVKNDSRGSNNSSDHPSSDYRPLSSVIRSLKVIHGIDFMLDLCAKAEKNNWSVGLLGGMNGTAEKTGTELLRRFPRLKIEYVYGDFSYSVGDGLRVVPPNSSGQSILETGKLKTDKPDADNRKLRTDNRILLPASHLDLLFVGLGTPKEQVWISQNKNSFPATVFMEVGGSFDVLGGHLKRAPKFLRQIGLEWLFRLLQEPKRLSRQLHLFEFLWRVLTTKNSIKN